MKISCGQTFWECHKVCFYIVFRFFKIPTRTIKLNKIYIVFCLIKIFIYFPADVNCVWK